MVVNSGWTPLKSGKETYEIQFHAFRKKGIGTGKEEFVGIGDDIEFSYNTEGECYATTACRMFPPGPYWEHDEPTQCAPEWIFSEANPFGKAASKNVTVNVLFKVHLDYLAQKKYEQAFEYVTYLTDPRFGEDRDVLFFPERLEINGKQKIVMLHRPFQPSLYPCVKEYFRWNGSTR
jgi:hypothetical protein